MRLLPFVLVLLSFVQPTLASEVHEHHMTQIVGPEIFLQFHDHGIAGSVKQKLLMGSMLEGKFGSKLTVRESKGNEVETLFEVKDEVYQGKVTLQSSEGTPLSSEIKFLSIDKASQTIWMELNGQEVGIEVSSEGMKGHHFMNPTYRLQLQGKPLEFRIVDGMACWGCSVNLIAMILSAYTLE